MNERLSSGKNDPKNVRFSRPRSHKPVVEGKNPFPPVDPEVRKREVEEVSRQVGRPIEWKMPKPNSKVKVVKLSG